MAGSNKRKHGLGTLSPLAEEVLFVLSDYSNESEALAAVAIIVISAEKYMAILRELVTADPKVVLRVIELAITYDYRLTFIQLNEVYKVCLTMDTKVPHGTRITCYQIRDLAMNIFRSGDSLNCDLAKSMPAMFHLLYGDLDQILKCESRHLSASIRKLLCQETLESSAIYKEIGIDAMILLANSTVIAHQDAAWEDVPKRLCYVKSLSPLQITIMDLIGEPAELCFPIDGVLVVKKLWNVYGDLSGTLYTFTGSKVVPCTMSSNKLVQFDPRIAPKGTYHELELCGISTFSRCLYRVNESLSRGAFEITFWL